MSDNRNEVNAALRAWAERVDQGAYRAAQVISKELERFAKENTNRLYVDPGQKGNQLQKGRHVFGAKNWDGSEPPNRRTGTLGMNIHGNPVQKGFKGYIAGARSEAGYSRALETEYKVKYMFMTPARNFLVETGKARQILINEIKRAGA